MRRGPRKDPVSPEDYLYVMRREGWTCIVGTLLSHRFGPCSGGLTLAHVRDRGLGGRLGRRPPSKRRHMVAACEGHHLANPIVDRREVRDLLDDYLKRMEGPEPPSNRPWERIVRVRGRDG